MGKGCECAGGGCGEGEEIDGALLEPVVVRDNGEEGPCVEKEIGLVCTTFVLSRLP